MQPNQLLLPLLSALLLSTLGMPCPPFIRRRGPSSANALRDRWLLFVWFHPFWAAALRWGAALIVMIAMAGALWRWNMSW